MEIVVRMGECAVSDAPGTVLVAIGLGSCIGVGLIEISGRRAGLAHVMLPKAPAGSVDGLEAKFADLAVPRLIAKLVGLGALRSRLEAVLVGGAQMFSFDQGESSTVGIRNEEAVRRALEAARIPVRAAATLGNRGRTIRVHVGSGLVTVKEAGGAESPLYRGAER